MRTGGGAGDRSPCRRAACRRVTDAHGPGVPWRAEVFSHGRARWRGVADRAVPAVVGRFGSAPGAGEGWNVGDGDLVGKGTRARGPIEPVDPPRAAAKRSDSEAAAFRRRPRAKVANPIASRERRSSDVGRRDRTMGLRLAQAFVHLAQFANLPLQGLEAPALPARTRLPRHRSIHSRSGASCLLDLPWSAAGGTSLALSAVP